MYRNIVWFKPNFHLRHTKKDTSEFVNFLLTGQLFPFPGETQERGQKIKVG